MKEALKEKFEQLLVANGVPYVDDQRRVDLLAAMQAAYDLAKAESEESINIQQQLLESMGDTNKQLGKRLLAVQHEIELDHTPSKCVNAIKLILNPPQQ